MEENMVVIKYPKSFCFNFDKNLKHEIQLVIKSNESLVKNKIKNEIEQLFLKQTYGNNIN